MKLSGSPLKLEFLKKKLKLVRDTVESQRVDSYHTQVEISELVFILNSVTLIR